MRPLNGHFYLLREFGWLNGCQYVLGVIDNIEGVQYILFRCGKNGANGCFLSRLKPLIHGETDHGAVSRIKVRITR
ncbi:hypothetical protein SAMN05428978_101542 [Nitrosomonas sp. Nm34]|nr:hypothetical protein SAMN05428978_101542 [Nitrosomonas sp. Nm34]